MSASRRILPLCAFLLAAPLCGCSEFDLAANGVDPAMTAKAPDAAAPVDATDDLAAAKRAFREGAFGLAEQSFRRAVEASPSNAEAWLGLAAAHDRLGRFDLADRDYAQVEKRTGRGFELLNNRGYSRMMRGDLAGARRDLEAAAKLRPDNDFVRNNLHQLDEKRDARG